MDELIAYLAAVLGFAAALCGHPFQSAPWRGLKSKVWNR